MRNDKFLDLVVEKGLMTREDRAQLLEKTDNDHFKLLLFLKNGGVAPKNFLGRLWGDSIGFAYVDLLKTIFQPEAVKMLPMDYALKYNVIPVYKLGSALTIVTSTPGDIDLIKKLSIVSGVDVSPVFSFPEDIEDAVKIQYQSKETIEELINKISQNSLFKGISKITEEQLKKISGDKAVINFTDAVILLGVKENATDIHIDPLEDVIKVRFRIDGVLQTRLKLDQGLLYPFVSRLKIMADLDITERRRPQDGRINLKLKNRNIDIRFASIPSVHGEKITLRLLGQLAVRDVPGLEDLSFSWSTYKKIEKICSVPNGIFLVTGPTGSGKTTTLFSILKRINNEGVNILTVEDPVEYMVEGVSQVQVNPLINLDFAAALRSFLRQDPDVILVGEIRDSETAKIASQAALTGHLVLATLHSNNSFLASVRLVDMGVQRFIVSPAITGVMSQRLVRRICEKCKIKYRLTDIEADEYFIRENNEEVNFFRGKGCAACNFTGYSGRIAIHEILLFTNEIRDIISSGGSVVEIEKSALKNGFKDMFHDGIKKVLRGLTTIEELERVVGKN
ncbi:MAG: type II/IV secretion system protein [Desulfobacteraceae bacterium]|nr:type II/IV secretion system protein [Desulfobacteraceae bacterium]MCB9494203.1 type II/IV secretion system protein [Desulfobacteraceae bacterium]